jgi:uncharacterized membrane protein YfcA
MMYVVLFAVAFAAGAINSIAGGGTLLTFPLLIAYGVPSVTANATSTVALVPGSFAAFWGFRKETSGSRLGDAAIFGVSAVGGLAGALLLVHLGNEIFSKLVPWLILGATGLFIVQEPLRRLSLGAQKAVATQAAASESDTSEPPLSARLLAVQFLVAIYGGFFGAASGILMLGVFGLLGYRNIHRMNRLKNLANVGFNTAASATFIIGGHVQWLLAFAMLVGAVVGGYGGAGIAKRIGQKNVKKVVIVVGLVMGVYTLVKTYWLTG